MKHKYIPIAILVATTLVAFPVFAQNTGDAVQGNQASSSLTNLRDRLKSQIEQKKQEIAQNKQEINSTRAELSTTILNNRVQNDTKVFTATANRLDKIIARIESRVTKIQAAGGNTTDIETNLNAGKTELAQARTDISAFSSIDLTGATSSTTVRTLLTTIKAGAVNARNALKTSKASLIQAVTLIMSVETKVKVQDSNVSSNNGEATTTNTSN